MKKLFVLMLLCLTCCCDETKEHAKIIDQQNFDMHSYIENVRYCKDIRTGLCFAGCPIYGGAYNSVLTNVPCTPEVEKLIK